MEPEVSGMEPEAFRNCIGYGICDHRGVILLPANSGMDIAEAQAGCPSDGGRHHAGGIKS